MDARIITEGEIDVRGVTSFLATLSRRGHRANIYVYVHYLEGHGVYVRSVVTALKRIASEAGADSLIIEAEVVNRQLEHVLRRDGWRKTHYGHLVVDIVIG